MGPIKIRLSDTALFGASAASREQAKAVAGACVFRASGASWEQAKAVAGACVTIGLVVIKADGFADTAQKLLGSAEQCLDTAFLSERSELGAGEGGSRSLRISSERSELGACGCASNRKRYHSSLCCHFSSFSYYLLLWVMCGSVAGGLQGG